MKIAYNGLFLTRPQTGMGQYTTHLLAELPKALPQAEHLVVVPERVKTQLPKRMKVKVLPPSGGRPDSGVALNRWETREVPEAAAAAGADLYFTPYPTPLSKGSAPVLMAVHDMIPWQLPEYRRSLRSRLKLRGIRNGIRKADHLLTVSKSARKDIAELAKVPTSRITVAYDGVPANYRRPPVVAIKKVQKKYGLHRPYVLHLGGYDYRKNVRRLVEAFAKSGLAVSHDLVLAGALTAPSTPLYADYRRLPRLLKHAGISGRTKRLGFVPEADKPALLAGADSFVFPSLAEGFSLPVLEALGVGTPAAASNIPAHKELFTGAAELFDPTDTAKMAAALKKTVNGVSAAQRRRGQKLAQTYTWEATAQQAAKAITRLLQSPGANV